MVTYAYSLGIGGYWWFNIFIHYLELQSYMYPELDYSCVYVVSDLLTTQHTCMTQVPCVPHTLTLRLVGWFTVGV